MCLSGPKRIKIKVIFLLTVKFQLTNNELGVFCFKITELCLKYMVYDPNYNYDEDESANGPNDAYDEDEEDEENDEYSDDDDMSWKVRRSAAKCLEAIISTRHEMLPDFFKILSPALIARFKGIYQ